MSNQHENVIHAMADKLLDFFEGSGAVNYIEQTFGCNDDPSKSFVITMQKVEGLTPCQKLADAEQRIEELEQQLKDAQIKGFKDGWEASGEGYNSEHGANTDEVVNDYINDLNSGE